LEQVTTVEREARAIKDTAARPALRLSPRPLKFVHRIDRSDDANAALVEVPANSQIVIVMRYVSSS